MKATRNVLIALLFLLGCAAGAASAATSFSAGIHVGPSGRAAVDLGFFYDNLASYGHWIQRPRYGWVWTPRSVAAGWRPYSYGHWIDSDLGWTWMSDEPFGWATYHYGRWYQDPEIGWAWVPGTQWGPAWVSWQEGPEYVGWAPLPPGANIGVGERDDYYDDGYGYDNGPGYDDGYGYDGGYGYDDGYGYGGYGYDGYGYGGSNVSVSFSFGLGPAAYLFVPTRYFLEPSLFSYYVPYNRIYPIFRTTRNCTAYRYYGGRYYNTGLPFDHIRRAVGRVPRYQLSELGNFRDGRYGARIEGNRVAFFQPRVDRHARVSPLSRPEARRSVITAQAFRNTYRDRVTRNRQIYQGDRQAQDTQRWQQRGQYGQYQGRQQQYQGQSRNDRQRGYEAQRQVPYQGGRQARPYYDNQQRAPRQQQYGQQYGMEQRQRAWEGQQRQQQQRYQEQYRAQQQRSYDLNQRWQAQAERQRGWQQQSQQRQQVQQYRTERQDRQQQYREAHPQYRENRGESRRGSESNGNGRQHGRGNGRGQ